MTMQPTLTLGQYIAEVMKSKGRARDQIAAAVKISGPYLSQITADRAVPSSKVLEDLIRELGLDPDKAHQLAKAAKTSQRLEAVQRQADRWELVLQAAGRGTLVLVIDTKRKAIWHIPMEIKGPELDKQGSVSFHLRTDQVGNLPDKFSLEMIFLFAVPHAGCLCSMRVGPKERQLLGSAFGLEFKAKLPDAPGLRELLKDLQEDQAPISALREGFAFRIIC